MYILFDIGGTKMRVAASRDGETFGEPVIVRDHHEYRQGFERFCETVESLREGGRIQAIAGGIAGPFDVEQKMLSNSPNLPDWVGKPFVADLEKQFNVPVFAENDAAVVGLGEAHRGAGRGYGIVVYITVSTGIGGARIVGGVIDEKAHGFEPGKQIIDLDSTVFSKCEHPTIENYISGKAFAERYGKPPYEITDEALWDEAARLLAYALNNTIVHWSPDCIVLGGSMIVKKPGIDVSAVRRHMEEIVQVYPELPEIKQAELGDFGGLHGALALIRQTGQEE